MKRWLLLFAGIALSTSTFATTVRFTTNMGSFDVKLASDKAPKTCQNFLRYVHDGSYKGTIFHRVIAGFVIQGGGYTKSGQQRPSYAPIVNESDNGLSNTTGTIAMARTQDPNSATRQFYINVHDNPFLDAHSGNPGYAVFGHVTDGMKVVMAIAHTPTSYSDSLGMQNVPTTAVVIQSIKVIQP